MDGQGKAVPHPDFAEIIGPHRDQLARRVVDLRRGSAKLRRGSAKAVVGQGKAVAGQGKAVEKQWKATERQWKGQWVVLLFITSMAATEALCGPSCPTFEP